MIVPGVFLQGSSDLTLDRRNNRLGVQEMESLFQGEYGSKSQRIGSDEGLEI